MHAASGLHDSVAIVDQWILDTAVGGRDDDDEVVLQRASEAFTTTPSLHIKFPFTLCKRRVGQKGFLKRTGVFTHVLFPLNHALTVGQGSPDVSALVVPKG